MNRRIHVNRIPLNVIRKKGLPLAAVALSLSMLAFTAPASADHDQPVVCAVHLHGGCTASCAYPNLKPYARIQYDRGYDQGEREGWELGYYDGLYGRRFCDQPDRRIRRFNPNFVDGYLDGFSDGYEAGFRKGRKECRPGRRLGQGGHGGHDWYRGPHGRRGWDGYRGRGSDHDRGGRGDRDGRGGRGGRGGHD